MSLRRLVFEDRLTGISIFRQLDSLDQNVPLFRPLQLATKEELATKLTRSAAEPGRAICTQGEVGDRFYIVESGGLIRFADPDQPGGHRDVQFVDDLVAFREVGPAGKVDHRLTNIGTKRHRNFVIELKRP